MSLDLSRRALLAGAAALPFAPNPARAAGQVVVGTCGGDYAELPARRYRSVPL